MDWSAWSVRLQRWRQQLELLLRRSFRAARFKISPQWAHTLTEVLAIALVPLTVAAMGWYWTRWQQDVSDLKSMIDLVTDKSPEKQKYGVAMFEYLARNDKVPVEFIAAQIDYASTAQNHELLPMLEVAILNAARENPKVATAYRLALEQRPARVFIHVPSEEAYDCLMHLRDALKDVDRASINFPAVRKSEGYSASTQELRFFHEEDKKRAQQIAGSFGALGLPLPIKDLSASEWATSNSPNTYELWFNGKPQPQLCQSTAAQQGQGTWLER